MQPDFWLGYLTKAEIENSNERTELIPAGSVVKIDTRKRQISSKKDWTREFQRPIYFLATREGYVCGWCELDKTSEWLNLIPHPLSPVSRWRWKYHEEIESVGRVVAVATRL
jgi:hypothetical protein